MIERKLEIEYCRLLKSEKIRLNIKKVWSFPNRNFSSKKLHYGWKIHISANINNCISVAKRFFEINKKLKLDYKIISSISYLEKINSGVYGSSQVGKFITIYPDQIKLNSTLETLYYSFSSYDGVSVESDYRYKLSNNVYYRYGTIDEDYLTIDNRDKKLIPYNCDIKDFFIERKNELPSNLLIMKTINHVGLSGVFEAMDLNIKKEVIVRYSTKNFDLSNSGIDRCSRLINSIYLIDRIGKNDNFEKIVDYYYLNNGFILITLKIQGDSFHQLAINGTLRKWNYKRKISVFFKVYKLIKYLHSINILYRDLSFSNVIFFDDKVSIIDLEFSISLDENDSYGNTNIDNAGTYGFYNPKCKKSDVSYDYYCLASFLYYLFYPDDYVAYINKVNMLTTYQEILNLVNKDKTLPRKAQKIYKAILNRC